MEKTIHEKIKNLREDNDYTQEYIAKYLHTTQGVVWKYESGETKKIPLEVIKKLCLLYNVTADWFLGLPKGMRYPKQ